MSSIQSTYITTYILQGHKDDICCLCSSTESVKPKNILWKYPKEHTDRILGVSLCQLCYPNVMSVTTGDNGTEALQNAKVII